MVYLASISLYPPKELCVRARFGKHMDYGWHVICILIHIYTWNVMKQECALGEKLLFSPTILLVYNHARYILQVKTHMLCSQQCANVHQWWG